MWIIAAFLIALVILPSGALSVVGFLCGLGSLLVFVSQVYGWLKSGVWEPHSVADVLSESGVQWALQPGSWLGVHKLLSGMPLSLFLLYYGCAAFIIADSKKEPTPKEKSQSPPSSA